VSAQDDTAERLRVIQLKLRRPALLKAWREVPAATKASVLALLDEEARVLRESDATVAAALVSALDVLDVLSDSETALHATSDEDVEWLLDEVRRRRP
jgi:hypothetical protein